jgi:lysophospholipase L1-like esterase
MQNSVNPWSVLVRGATLFLLLEYALLSSGLNFGRLDVYGALGLKRLRFPYSTHGPEDDALEVGNLDAMFASHIVSQPKAANEFRVLLLGDSAAWGLMQQPEQTFPGQLDALHLACGNRIVRVYNLSYVRSSSTKDLMILDKAMQYQPDMIIWAITLYTLMPKSRVDHWLIEQNPEELYSLNARFHFLPKKYPPESTLDRLLDPQRAMFRVLRYQLYSLVNLATGVDQIQTGFENVPLVLSSDTKFEGMNPPTVSPDQISIDQVKDFYELTGGVPVLLINEPIMILSGIPNSDVRYNAYYPRWVYDQYRQILTAAAAQNGWNYLDLWNMFPSSSFTNTPLHLNPEGERKLAEAIAPSIQKNCP